ncbi:MAG: citramalate synthase [Sandaracinus sp.]|nr:citramalate synthase [Sandaracinus sp.]MCB9611095.1 citramalate synthase [Sandaracinus sp.]MCB9634215.1 citramalate synthase [Sandaracinus sp.]
MSERPTSRPSARPPQPAVELYDTTLRDGTQREGLSLSVDDKLRIAERLGALGMRYVEAGWPGSNPKDAAFFQRAKGRRFGEATVVAFGSTARPGIAPDDDLQLRALLEAETSVVTIFGKSWTRHVEDVLLTTREENLRMIERSVAFLRSRGRRVFYDAEHFFDGYATDADYALATLRAAQDGGAEALVLCDTNGGSLPWTVDEVVRRVRSELSVAIGVHCHDDSGCAVANSLAAVRAGATQVQGTINGYGERCGNANLVTIAPDLELKLGFRCLPDGKLAELTSVSRFVADLANLPPDAHAPYVGKSAFAHKGGVHVSAIRRDAGSYQHIEPELVGNECRVVVSELSGKSNVLSKAEELGLRVEGGEGRVLETIKEREARGYSYEAAEASVALLVERQHADYVPPFVVLDYRTGVARRRGTAPWSEATVKVALQNASEDDVRVAAGEGSGPVAALDVALREALKSAYPGLETIHLVDYKVRILDGHDGTDATTRVLLECERDGVRWSTVGASKNIVEASLEALVDGYEYGLRHFPEPAVASSAAQAD